MTDKKQYDLINDKLPSVFFFKSTYDNTGKKCLDVDKTDSMNPYVINQNVSNNLDNINKSDKLVNLNNKIDENIIKNNNNGYNNFILNYIKNNNYKFENQRLNNNKKYKNLNNKIKKQLEYLTCRNLNDNFKLYDDKINNNYSSLLDLGNIPKSSISDIFNFINTFNISNTSDWIKLVGSKGITNLIIVAFVFVCLIFIIFCCFKLGITNNIYFINFISYVHLIKNKNILFIIIIISFLLIIGFLIGTIINNNINDNNKILDNASDTINNPEVITEEDILKKGDKLDIGVLSNSSNNINKKNIIIIS